MPCRGELCKHRQPTTIKERLQIAEEFQAVTGRSDIPMPNPNPNPNSLEGLSDIPMVGHNPKLPNPNTNAHLPLIQPLTNFKNTI